MDNKKQLIEQERMLILQINSVQEIFCLVNYKQLFGSTKPNVSPITLLQVDLATCFKCLKCTLCSLIPLQGYLVLQSNFITIGVADVPRIF